MARQSLAGGLAAASQLVTDAEDIVAARNADLADAAKRRRAVELLGERHAEAVRVSDLAADQRNLDELAVTSRARNAARGLDAQNERRANSMRQSRSAQGGDTA